MLTLLFVLLMLFLVASIPIYIALGMPSLVGVAVSGIPWLVVAQRLFGGLDKFALMSIPFFILGANVMGRGGMSRRILDLSNVLVGWIPGGTAVMAVLACLMFGALSGSSPATVVAIGSLVYPMLLQNGYSERFSMGLVASASSLAILIPPSITMIVYASVTGASVGELFLGGVGPGLVMGALMMVYSVWYAARNNVRTGPRPTMREAMAALKRSAWALGVPIIIIGGIYGGVFTPTESATVAAVYAILVCMFIYRELNWQSLYQVCVDSAVTTAQIMMLIAAAAVLSWVLTIGQVQHLVTELLGGSQSSPFVILLLMNLMLIVAGMFMDAAPFILLLAPLFLPVATGIGVDPVHLGIIMTINGALGMFTPPFGLNLFVGMGVFKRPFGEVARAVVPFIVLSIIAILLVTYIPQIAMWLPNRAYGR